MLIVSDVHGAFDALGRLATRGETVLVLGDLINLVDYRTNEGILADVVGRDVVESVVGLRSVDDSAANRMWATRTAALGFDVRLAVGDAMRCEYERMRNAIDGLDAYVIPGNVDDPDLLRTHLPSSATWVDGDVIDFEGEAFGFVGRGVERIGSAGEIDDATMRDRLDALGRVDVLCTHVPAALPMVCEDVIGGTGKGSVPVREYLDRHRPRLHYYGDVHQPRATSMTHGATTCINVGYFRATGRAVHHRSDGWGTTAR